MVLSARGEGYGPGETNFLPMERDEQAATIQIAACSCQLESSAEGERDDVLNVPSTQMAGEQHH